MTGRVTCPTMCQIFNTLWAGGLDTIFSRIGVISFATVDRYGIRFSR